MECFYFHNFLYDFVWRDNRRRHSEKLPVLEITRTYGPDHKLILVGDATMSPYEITIPGGSVEYWNGEAGEAGVAVDELLVGPLRDVRYDADDLTHV